MMIHRLWPTLLVLLGSGCFVGTSDRGLPDGTLVVDWTVDGSKDPTACSDNGADSFDVIITTSDGVTVDDTRANCEDFSLSVSLPPDLYSIDGVLLDAHGHQITTAVRDRVRVRPAESDVSAIDFPADSFL
jgi:hypothetical protein